MPTKCDDCGLIEYAIYRSAEYKNLCLDCYNKVRPPYKFDPDDLVKRESSTW